MLRWFEPLLVPGLLETESYARAALSWKPFAADAEATLRDSPSWIALNSAS